MILTCFALVTLSKLVTSQNPSPCPETFSYEPKGVEDDRWYGSLSLRSADDLTGVYINILLDKPVELLGNWFGDATSSDNTEFIIVNQKYKLEAGPPVSIRFFVKYNRAQTVPSIKTIRLNGKTICSTKKDENELRPTTPQLHISHTRPTGRPISSETSESRPNFNSNSNTNGQQTQRPAVNSRPNPTLNSGSDLSNNSSERDDNESDTDSEVFLGDFASAQRPSQNRPTSSSKHDSIQDPGCGTVATRASPLISNGQDTTPGQWPWHAAIYQSKGIQLMYTCGATLITKEHLLTAAHCVTKLRSTIPVSTRGILVYLGKYNLLDFGTELQDRGVSKIFVHPDYNHSSYFNDIAVLKLTAPVDLTNFVRPCCLWDEESDVENIINKSGTVVGWGFDHSGQLSNKLTQAQMPVVSAIKCIYSNRDFFSQFTFEKNFCAGFRNGTSVCNGDSGGGMVFPKRGTSGQSTVWQIRGIVSVGVALQGQGRCDTSQYSIFTDVAKYTHWIRQVVAI